MIRRMKEADLVAVQNLLSSCPEAAQWSPAIMLRDSPGISCALVEETQGSIFGFIALRIVATEGELLNLAVAPERRQRGVGRELLDAALERARKSGAQRIFLEVRVSNIGARALYASLGFAGDGRRSNYYSDPIEDALVLSKVLA